MSTVVATVVTDIQNRLKVGSTTPEPDATMLGNWVRSAAKYCIGQCQPVKETTVTVTSGPQAALIADDVYYVANGHEMLLPSEWSKQGNAVVMQRQAARARDTLTVWYFLDPDITSATTTFDTTCIFGTDWLEEVITVMAMQQVEARLSNLAGSVDGQGHAAMYRVMQDERERLLAPHRDTRNQWFSRMDNRVMVRAQMGNLPYRESAYSRFKNRSAYGSDLTGVRSRR